ncbi:uncharacterized protein ATC70_010623 [Mucor velutinosus]|uniref:Uncharacterized protein n=1 Tax=Mucor velutinosus TaxID=708070 RepID=A0AAN7DDZ0_9FUNG|nr:hypothetical protein ATC70_010623 [Mucor velutinosus]
MSIFQPKPSIQLSTDQEQSNSASQRPHTFSRKSSSSWSIPCCSHISLGKSGGRIQLPDDSDNDSADEEYNPPSSSPFNTAYSEDTQSQNLPNVFSQAQARSQTALSRNPFARVDEQRQSKTADKQMTPQTEHQIDSFISEASGEEELANFTRSRFTKYDDEPDWTEAYKDDGDKDDEHIDPVIKGIQIQDNGADIEDDGKSDISKDASNTQTTHTAEPSVISTEQTHDTSSSIARSTDEEEDVQTEKKEDKVPQIEEEVLHLLPLPELSNEIPPAMIHKKASFEKSMYGEQPLMSVSRNQGSRISRFSMTEEDYLALKKAEEQERRVSSLNVQSTASSTHSAQNQNTIAKEEHLPAVGGTNSQQESVKDDRRASIAQSILGDKLDDFTEKLAFIKKNIIMSIDSDEEDDEEISAEKILKKMEQVKSTSASNPNSSIFDQKPPPTLHRRTSSLMDAVPTIARFMNQIGGGSSATPEPSTSTNVPLSSSQTSTSSFSPSSLFSALAGPMPEPSSTLPSNKKMNDKRAIKEEGSGDEDDDEELFDFTKVLEIGKNVKTFGEGFVGNGIRMFNDVATRMKTTVEEEQRRAAQISAQKNESTSTASSSNNENEWMHNYL